MRQSTRNTMAKKGTTRPKAEREIAGTAAVLPRRVCFLVLLPREGRAGPHVNITPGRHSQT
jgi:hypothetical protein